MKSPDSLPLHMQLALSEDIEGLRNMSLDPVARQDIIRFCVIAASAQSPGWVDLAIQWGVNLDDGVSMRNGEHTQNWLWHALARGKLPQAVALVRHGARLVHVDSRGQSGLGILLENTWHDQQEAVIDAIEQMCEHGLSWRDFPDALAFDGSLRKNVGCSLNEQLCARSHMRLSKATMLRSCHNEFHRL